MDEYEQYLADAEYEDYLRQAQAEQASIGPVQPDTQNIDLSNAIARGSSDFMAPANPLGPDYNKGYLANAWEGIKEAPAAVGHMASDVYNFVNPWANGGAGGPIDTIMGAGAEKTAQNVGGFSSGLAGAGALAPIGAGWGSMLGPLGAFAGGALGGGVGFAGGMLGFNAVTDAAQEGVNAVTGQNYGPGLRPLDQYGKDFAYNAAQGTLLGGASDATLRAVQGVRNLPTRAGFTQEGAGNRVAAQIQQLEPEALPRIEQALAEGSADPFLNYKPLGELIDSDVLKNAQRTIARSGPEAYGKSAEANRIRNSEHLQYLNEIEKSAATPADVQAAIQQGIDAKLAAGQRGLTAAEGNVNAALGDLPLPIDALEAGSAMREGASTGKDAIRGQVTAKFEGMGQGIVDTSGVQAVAGELLPKYFKDVGAQASGELTALIKDLSREAESTGILDASGNPIVREQPMTLKDVQALRSKALDIANGGDARTAAVAGKIADALKKAGDDAVSSGTVSPAEMQNWKDGISLRKTQGEIYESSATPTKSVLSKQPYGEFKVPESAVPSKYFRAGEKGTREAIQNYKKAIGNSEEALDPLYRYATDSFRDYVVKDGKVDGSKARKWLERHDSALQELPDLKRQLSNVDEAQRFLNEKYGDLQRTQAEVEKGALKQFLQVDPEKAIGAMLSGKDMVKRTIQTVNYLKANDIDALAGLRRGVIEHLKQKTFIPDGKVSLEEASMRGGPQFDGTVRGGVLKSEWEKIKPALERSKLFTESQMKGFDYLYRDKASQLSVEKAKMPGGSDTAQNTSTLAALTRAASSGFLRNLPYGRYVAFLEPVLKAIPKAKYQAMLEEALLNPRVARDLMAKANAKNFTRSAEGIFQKELAQAFGDKSAIGAAGAALDTGGAMSPVIEKDERKAPAKLKTLVPKQEQVLSKSSFPNPQDLLRPPTTGTPKKISLDVDSIIAQQDPETRARISVESSNDPFAVSRKGAQGLSQLMPATAQDIAKSLGETYIPLRPGMPPEQQRASIEQNIRFGSHYMNVMLPKIDPAFKNETLARAAYNAGPRRVQEAIALAGSSRDVNKVLANLPKGVQKETIPYVQRIAQRYGNV